MSTAFEDQGIFRESEELRISGIGYHWQSRLTDRPNGAVSDDEHVLHFLSCIQSTQSVVSSRDCRLVVVRDEDRMARART